MIGSGPRHFDVTWRHLPPPLRPFLKTGLGIPRIRLDPLKVAEQIDILNSGDAPTHRGDVAGERGGERRSAALELMAPRLTGPRGVCYSDDRPSRRCPILSRFVRM